MDYAERIFRITLLEPIASKIKTIGECKVIEIKINLDQTNPLDRIELHRQTSELLYMEVVLSTASAKRAQKTITNLDI